MFALLSKELQDAENFQNFRWIDLTAGSGVVAEPWERHCSPGILASLAAQGQTDKPIFVDLYERNGSTFGQLYVALRKHLPRLGYREEFQFGDIQSAFFWFNRRNGAVVRLSFWNSLHIRIADLQEHAAINSGTAVFVLNDPNAITDWAFEPHLAIDLLKSAGRLQVFHTTATNPAGLKRLPIEKRWDWFDHFEQTARFLREHQSLALFALKDDSAKFAYLLQVNRENEKIYTNLVIECYARYGYDIRFAWLRKPICHEDLSHFELLARDLIFTPREQIRIRYGYLEKFFKMSQLISVHPIAKIFPLVHGEELACLVEDIKENGQHSPVTLSHDGTVLIDGRSRKLACEQAGVEPIYEYLPEDYTDAMIRDFIISKNIKRRHLNKDQLAMVALEIEKIDAAQAKERERQRKKGEVMTVPDLAQSEKERKSRQRAANAVGTSATKVQQAKKVSNSDPQLAAKVSSGATSLDSAYKQVQARERAQPKPEIEKPTQEILTLFTHECQAVPYPRPKGKATFNLTPGHGISWAGWSWNPVTGCLHGCKYCYARELAHKPSYASAYPVGFTPLFHHERLDAPANTKVPENIGALGEMQRVFVCSMADLYGKWVPDEWIQQVHASCIANPQWQYLIRRADRNGATGWRCEGDCSAVRMGVPDCGPSARGRLQGSPQAKLAWQCAWAIPWHGAPGRIPDATYSGIGAPGL